VLEVFLNIRGAVRAEQAVIGRQVKVVDLLDLIGEKWVSRFKTTCCNLLMNFLDAPIQTTKAVHSSSNTRKRLYHWAD
jgi:hypothetical protein